MTGKFGKQSICKVVLVMNNCTFDYDELLVELAGARGLYGGTLGR